jgi:hypothetical protein
LSEGAVRGGMPRVPSLEMPPVKFERAKPLALKRRRFSESKDRPRNVDGLIEPPVNLGFPVASPDFPAEPARSARAVARDHRRWRGGRKETGGCSNSFNSAISRSLLDVASIARSSVLVRAVCN